VPGPLDGYRILDLTAMITGPQTTMILGDQGADVVKVEPPGLGDVMRYLGTQRGGIAALFGSFNRSKRSIVVNLQEEAGREIVMRLAAGADVFIQNFRPGVIERLGLDEQTLRAPNKDLIYVSLSAFGEEGPLARRPAYDHIIQGMTGASWVQPQMGSERPEYMKMAWCDKITGYTAAQAITAALLARERGQGAQHLRLSMLGAALSFFWPDGMMNHTILEEDTDLQPHISMAYRFLETSDGFLSVAAVTDAQWQGIFRAAGRPELCDDPRFASAAERMKNVPALLEELGGGKLEMTSQEAHERLIAEDVPCGPLLRPEEVASHPQVVETGVLVESEHPAMGRIREPRPPTRFSATPAAIGRPAPALGEHTDEVLGEAGLSPAEIEEARAKGIVA
jgi:crotonobetainyl-CoA:carnitine CoA-transferase CaiB-like acyl-CoA transferase